ncbi:protein HESO1-like [Rosa sericea]
MALSRTELLNEAKKLELQGLQKYLISPLCMPKLDQLLNDVYAARRPKPIDYRNRRDLIRIFNAISKELYGNIGNSPVVEVYGSFVMDLFSDESDLDLSVNFSNSVGDLPRDMKIKTLRKFAKKFFSLQRAGHVAGVQTIMSARVPIIKLIDCGTGIECDLSIENRDGIVKSQIVYIISRIDGRFQKLSFMMKAWAKAHNINCPKDRTLSSFGIISLVAFHLQTRDPPILPPLSTLFEDGTDPATVMKRVDNYLEFGKRNKESVADLFFTLLVKVASADKLWQKGLCASLYEGSWTSKLWDPHYNSINVEDFTDPSQNVARAVGTGEFQEIYRCIHSSLSHLLAFSDNQMEGNKLVDLLFGTKSVCIPSKAKHPPHLNGHQTKRMRVSKGWEENQPEEGWKGKQSQGSGTAQHVEVRGGRQQADGPVGTMQVDGLGGAHRYHDEATSNLNAKDETPVVHTQTPLVGTLCNSISPHTPLVS